MFIPLAAITLVALAWLIWQWRSGALLNDPPAAASEADAVPAQRSAPALQRGYRVELQGRMPVPHQRGFFLHPTSRDAA